VNEILHKNLAKQIAEKRNVTLLFLFLFSSREKEGKIKEN